jgi:mannitol/fructose-specific phosphotransferase system IIA component (Ntr-type)
MDRRSAWAVGLAMNARGAMEMILGMLALRAGLIREQMFVALVVMALFTSLISAPSIHFLISRRRVLTLKDVVNNKLFLPELDATTRLGALRKMCEAAADEVSNSPERFFRIVSERERLVPSGWDDELAVPYARIDGLIKPLAVVAKSKEGIDFDARDGKPARLIVLILTPDNQSQHDLLGDASELFSRSEAKLQALEANSFVELIAALKAPVK